MRRIAVIAACLVVTACSPSPSADAGLDAGNGGGDAGLDAGVDAGVDGGDAGEPALSCDVPAGGDEGDVELVQAWSAFVADESHFTCEQDDDCVVVNYRNVDVDWCGCLGGGLTGKEGIAVNAAAAEEAEAMTERALSDDCLELQELLNDLSCDGNPPIGASCVEGRCALDYDPCGWCGTNGCEDAGP